MIWLLKKLHWLHSWSNWELEECKLNSLWMGNIDATVQTRECKVCGYRQVKRVRL